MNAASKLSINRSIKPEPEDDAKTEMPPPKAGFLPTVLGSVIMGFLLLAPLVLGHRYEIVAVTRSENALVYRIDTLTGRVSLCSAAQCLPVMEKSSDG